MRYIRNQLPDNLPWLPNYERAVKYHDAVSPFARGRNIGVKPLGTNRRYIRFQISQRTNDGAILIKHYDTYILQYNPDNSLLIDSGQNDTVSTC